MSKKKDRENTKYKNCPICGGKRIIVYSKKIFKRKYYIHCYHCNEDIKVLEAHRKETLDYIEIKEFFKNKNNK